MVGYSLEANEVPVLKDEAVNYGKSFINRTYELLLTNINLVLTEKGAFGGVKSVRVFPLDQIKVHQGVAQALLTKHSSGSVGLEVYFVDGQEEFRFSTGGRKKVLDWSAKINEVITGKQVAPNLGGAAMAIPGADVVASVVKDTIGVFKSRLGGKKETPAPVAGKCGTCGAGMTGTPGESSSCDYCGSVHQW